MVKCLNIGKNIGQPIYRSISSICTTVVLQIVINIAKKKKHMVNFHFVGVILMWSVILKLFYLCYEHLQHMCSQTDDDVFLICWCFFYLHVLSEVAAR